MKAAFRTEYGPPDVLSIRELEPPRPGDDDLLVRVAATTVNRTDCGGLWGAPFVYRFFTGLPRPKHTATGTDFAGVVEAVGKNVTDFRIGDRVFGFDDNGAGTHSQLITFSAKKGVLTIPEGVSFVDAAASCEGAHYAYNFLRKVPLAAGQHVLVNGATGGIGSAAVQLLKHRGLRVTAVCAGMHVERVRQLGADDVIDYEREDFTQREVTYDFVFDSVGKSTFGRCRRIMKPGGAYLSSELGPWGQNPLLALLTPLLPGKKVRFPLPLDIKRSLTHVKALLEQGAFTPLIDRTYRLEEIRDAFSYVASGRKIGNVILDLT